MPISKAIAEKIARSLGDHITNAGAVRRLEKAITARTKENIKFVKMTPKVFSDINEIRLGSKLEPLTKRQVTAYKNAVNNHLAKRVTEGMSARDVSRIAFDSLANKKAFGVPAKGTNQIAASPFKERYNTSLIGLAKDGGTSLKSIVPKEARIVERNQRLGQQLDAYNGIYGIQGEISRPVTLTSISHSAQNVKSKKAVYERLLKELKKRGLI